jgi:protein-tyrosine phosphatase
MKRVLFLCSGNYYRSRFSELVFNHHAEKHGLPWRADSAGLLLSHLSLNIGPISSDVVDAMLERGIDLAEPIRNPRSATLEDFEAAHHVVALKEAEHRAMMLERFPEWAHRITYWHVHDVDVAPPHEILPALERAVIELAERLAGRGGI